MKNKLGIKCVIFHELILGFVLTDVSATQEQMKTLYKDFRIVGRDLNWRPPIAKWDG